MTKTVSGQNEESAGERPLSGPQPILILDNTFAFGGAINSLCYLLSALNRNLFEPILVTGQNRKFLASRFKGTWYRYVPRLPWINNEIYSRFAKQKVFRSGLLRKGLSLWRVIYWLVFVYVPEAVAFSRLGRRHHVGLVHLNNIPSTQLSGILTAKFLKVPCVAHHRDFDDIRPSTRLYARLIDRHVAISSAVREHILQLGVPPGRITIVHDAIDLAQFKPAENRKSLIDEFNLGQKSLTFGLFGRVVEWKGVREFILAASNVVETMPSAIGFVVGGPADADEEYFLEMKKLVVELGLENNIVFTGFREDVSELMALMDVVVHASNRPEPFGMVIIEGMAMSKPVIATRGGGALDIVDEGGTGFLVDMGDSVAMGQAICSMLQQPDLREKMGKAGRLRVEKHFTNTRYAENMSKIYQDVQRGM